MSDNSAKTFHEPPKEAIDSERTKEEAGRKAGS